MKWMSSAAIVFVAVSATVNAQSAKHAGGSSKMDGMSMAYTGCIVVANHGAAVLLTNIAPAPAGSMAGTDAMKGDMAKDGTTMKPASTPAGAAAMGSSKMLALTGVADLQDHAGQMVSATGVLSDAAPIWRDLPTLTVRSLKVVAKSCEQEKKQ
jgi:hypothetical protein